MTWVKICGITNLEDALVAVEAGADAVGFVFYEKSPRCVSVETAREVVGNLPEKVEKVGVFVGGVEPDWVRVVLAVGLTAVQQYFSFEPKIHSNRSKAVGMGVFQKPLKNFFALPLGHFLESPDAIEGLAKDFANWGKNLPEGVPAPQGLMDTFLLDSGSLRRPGGTGTVFDWKKVLPIAQGMRQGGLKLVVAGGLTSENVGEAMRILQPWGVDVASGVEARPGKKDPEKVRAFVRAVRDADRKVS